MNWNCKMLNKHKEEVFLKFQSVLFLCRSKLSTSSLPFKVLQTEICRRTALTLFQVDYHLKRTRRKNWPFLDLLAPTDSSPVRRVHFVRGIQCKSWPDHFHHNHDDCDSMCAQRQLVRVWKLALDFLSLARERWKVLATFAHQVCRARK